jgi:hypothetical protein
MATGAPFQNPPQLMHNLDLIRLRSTLSRLHSGCLLDSPDPIISPFLVAFVALFPPPDAFLILPLYEAFLCTNANVCDREAQ